MGGGLALLGAGGFSGSASGSVVLLFVLSCSASCRRDSEKILKRFWVGMLVFVFIPAVGVIVDLDLLRTVIGWSTYSVAFLLALGHASVLVASIVRFVFLLVCIAQKCLAGEEFIQSRYFGVVPTPLLG